MFIAYNVSLDLIRALRPLVPAIQKSDRDLAVQLRRAATSVSLNLGEGSRREGGDKRRHFEMAHSWGYVLEQDVPRQLLDRLLALLWRLTHGRARLPDDRDPTDVTARLAAEARTRGQA